MFRIGCIFLVLRPMILGIPHFLETLSWWFDVYPQVVAQSIFLSPCCCFSPLYPPMIARILIGSHPHQWRSHFQLSPLHPIFIASEVSRMEVFLFFSPPVTRELLNCMAAVPPPPPRPPPPPPPGQALDRSVPCWNRTASSGSECSLPDLNYKESAKIYQKACQKICQIHMPE